MTAKSKKWYTVVWDIARGACPTCRQAKIFRSPFRMNETCPVCGVKYERETGYFLMSIFVAYGLYYLFGIPFVIWLVFLDLPWLWFWVLAISFILISFPLIFHYARIFWIHVDDLLDPRKPVTGQEPAGPDAGSPLSRG